MFTGFPSENTPAIQVWDCTRGNASISLTDDCAPIQLFKTGVNTASIRVNLPTAPVEGKRILFINNTFGSNEQVLNLYCSDINQAAATYYEVAPAQPIELCYTKQVLTPATNATSTGWISTIQGSLASGNVGSVVFGGTGNKTRGTNNGTIGGTGNFAYANGNAIAGGRNGSVGGQYSTVAGGDANQISSNYDGILGGASNNISGTYSGIVGGSSNSITTDNSGIIGSSNSTTDNTNAVVLGGQYGTPRGVAGRCVIPGNRASVASALGVSQSGLLVLGIQTTNATTATLRSNTSVAGTGNQLTLPNNAAYYVRGSCIANVTGGGDTKAWSFEAAIKRGASAAATSIVGAVIKNVVAADAGASTWDITIDADTTNGCLRVQVTGQAATTIRWVCRLDSTEVTF